MTIEQTATIPQAAQLMAAREITRLVVTHDDALAGIVTRSDLLKAFPQPDDRLLQRIRREVVVHALWDDPFIDVVGVVNELAWVYDDTASTPAAQPSPELRRRP